MVVSVDHHNYNDNHAGKDIIVSSRSQNEKEYRNWVELPEGGRRYWRERPGIIFGFQRFIKIVDTEENTLIVLQEIYDNDGQLIERHQKYPQDTGHEVIKRQQEP